MSLGLTTGSSHCWRVVIKQKAWVVSWSLGIGGTLVHFVYGSWSCTLLHWCDNMQALSFLVLLSSSEGFFCSSRRSSSLFMVHGQDGGQVPCSARIVLIVLIYYLFGVPRLHSPPPFPFPPGILLLSKQG
ncbi:predicted protein [Lichtheimia corymbifera JMRC:FSU:9682]|uniref:Uncharacterized protein n=1 Tax=Lichtheimia corymbifera JMRC:FSU:9682 TaxID=1263082 RepID=A0A068SGK2_9FUNG|nr:predicted protein [Lichtheimia corymbifera JMRC:FSU:9682]